MNAKTKENFKNILKKVKQFPRKCLSYFRLHPFLRCLFISFLMLYLGEALSRHSVFGPIVFLFKSPYSFLFNYLIILLTYSIALFFPRKGFALAVVSTVWLALTVTNCIILIFRLTPFSATDFSMVVNMMGIIDIYLNLFQLLLIIAGILLFIALLIFFWRKNPKSKVDFKHNSIFLISVVAITMLAGFIGNSTGLLCRSFPNINKAYKDYGFAYCFTLSIFDTGIDEPEEYAPDTVEDILRQIDFENNVPPENTPNIIVIQLESFFDVNRITPLRTETDPVPNLTYLKNNYPHGLIEVPSIGGGTANTEFEILTGMNLDHFGPGEYPYKTIMQTATCESPAFTLKNYGYTAHALHNHTATFYDRLFVYSSLGFDTFTSLEMMYGAEQNELGWAKDKVLTEHIISCLNSTEGKDFIFTVTVQAHGKYPDDVDMTEDSIKVDFEGSSDDDVQSNYQYFIEQINDSDAFIGALLAYLSDFDEPTAVLLYGDHFPTIELDDGDLSEGTIYHTDWVIWANYELDCENKTLSSYQLMSHFLGALGSNLGTTTKIHQKLSEQEDYQDKLEMLEYDILYGDMIAYDGTTPYSRTNIELGVQDIYITALEVKGNDLYITGNRFNTYTKVKLNNKFKDTDFVDENHLIVKDISIEDYEKIQLSQHTRDRVELRKSAVYDISSFIPQN
ncbi:MAG: LTA synthase family protein [Clostridia bacterium]|nr:LTA synthase family protein [Clostridia bacterium]